MWGCLFCGVPFLWGAGVAGFGGGAEERVTVDGGECLGLVDRGGKDRTGGEDGAGGEDGEGENVAGLSGYDSAGGVFDCLSLEMAAASS